MMRVELVPGWQLYLYSALGALCLWIKADIQHKKVHGFSDILENILPEKERAQYLFLFVVFVLFGGFIGLIFVGPFTQLQAIAGGMAWSRLAARD